MWLPFCLAGYIVVPTLVLYGLHVEQKTGKWPWTQISSAYGHEYKGLPKWASIFDNQGDSIFGPPNYYPGKGPLYSAFMFNVVRNPVNGLRFTPPFNLEIEPATVRWTGSRGSYIDPAIVPFEELARAHNYAQGLTYDSKTTEYWLLCWSTKEPLKMNFRIQYRNRKGIMMKFHVGFKIYPKDLQGFTIPYRVNGAGNAIISWRKV